MSYEVSPGARAAAKLAAEQLELHAIYMTPSGVFARFEGVRGAELTFTPVDVKVNKAAAGESLRLGLEAVQGCRLVWHREQWLKRVAAGEDGDEAEEAPRRRRHTLTVRGVQ